jgi:hypothetical protein
MEHPARDPNLRWVARGREEGVRQLWAGLGLALTLAGLLGIAGQAFSGAQPWDGELSDNLIFAKAIPFALGLGVMVGALRRSTRPAPRVTAAGGVRRFNPGTAAGHWINATGFILANAVQGPFTLVPNVPHREHVVLALNMGNWLRTAWPLTHDDQLTLTLGLQGRYTTGLIQAAFGLTSVLPWQAPLRSYNFDTKNSTFTNVGTNVRWSVPYKLNTTGFLSGPATIAVEVANETSPITSNTTAVTLGGPISGLMNFTLSQSQALELTTTNHTLKVTIRVTLANGLSATIVQFIPWRRIR